MESNKSKIINECELKINSVLKNQNIVCDDVMLKRFKIYYNFLVEYNQNVNLTALTEVEDVYIKHFADSILGQKYIKQNATVCDIGTGAGFPGVVLKIVRPDIKLVLVDSLNKRVEFLKQLLDKLDISDVDVLHYRAEDVEFKNKYLNTFDIVVARAVARLNTLCEYCVPFIKVGGYFVSYKSSDIEEELNEVKSPVKKLGAVFQKTEKQNLDENTERTFVLFKKVAECNQKYPRGQNKPKLKPLK